MPIKKSFKEKQTFLLKTLWMGALIFVCLWAMKLCPIWNGEIVNHRGQYEDMAEALLKGHLYLDMEADEKLLRMENPYDVKARETEGADFFWDHAYYKGRYYMYFGVVPVFLLFLPYRVLTGTALTTYHATQVFTAFIIIGFFVFFEYLRKTFFPSMRQIVCTALSTAFSLASVWYFVEAPALYCTAISAAVCMVIWLFYFYFRAVFDDISFNKRIVYAVIGGLFGALSFGCRPTVALANIAVIPLCITYAGTRQIKKADLKKVPLILIPYAVIGLLLMAYNYARFENPFEFGQAYQLTIYDQHDLKIFSAVDIRAMVRGLRQIFFGFQGFSGEFPFIRFGGIFIEFPLLLFGPALLIFSGSVRRDLKEKGLWGTVICMAAALLLIAAAMIHMSPIILERYQSDLVFLLAVMNFPVIGLFTVQKTGRTLKMVNSGLLIFSGLTCISAVLLFLVPNDMNFTQYYPGYLLKMNRILNDLWSLLSGK